MQILVMAGQLMLSLSILVILHELGHFVPARWFGCRVEKFYLFFDPWFELFKKKIGETEWGIGWLPLGGYVKISGMIDESMDTDQMSGPPQPWEFRSKPAWQRLIIMLGGVTVNFVLGFTIFIGMLWFYGRSYYPNDAVKDGIYAECLGEMYGLQTGDRILAIDSMPLEKFGDQYVKNEILLRGRRNLTVLRGGQELIVTLPDSLQRKLTSKSWRSLPLFSIPLKPVADTLFPDFPAAQSEMRKGDLVTAVNGQSVRYLQDVRPILDATEGQEVQVTVRRDGQLRTFPVALNENKRMGFAPFIERQYQTVEETFTLARAIPEGFRLGVRSITDQFDAVGQIFDDNIDASQTVGSVFTMAEAFGPRWDWQRFWSITGLLSLILAIMNLLPIPALDGGHVMFLLYEVVTGRAPGDKFLQYATTAGTILLLGFMVLVLVNDAFKAVRKAEPVEICP